jgi:RNA polymerase sigma factor (sigma-70 family)
MAEPEAIAGQARRDEAADDDRSRMAAFHAAFGDELRRFVLGVVRDATVADDVVQSTFLKAVESGHAARPETYKGWVFRIAYHEALACRRKDATRDRGRLRLAGLRPDDPPSPEDGLIRGEVVARVGEALAALPEEQRKVVWSRIYEDKTFAEIAGEFGLPLGTVLTRMRRALEKMRRSMSPGD